ncbi:hypothetical protein FW774_01275 (plasmid) [Pedobacter sp. BS3]|uniref:hypothetical protein n=1 Tax=Pedobacter sp. BS3 TaxID=2567937 RepID=UPI0011EBCBFE|nr:hypothetical protein [Pedobacter sp. BS3]TZF85734.1 hypothetical protein FW774_01275 [Pedobacter sp. BS3]
MAENQENNNQDIITLLKEYVSDKVELVRLTIIERIILIVANLITDGLVVLLLVVTLFFGSMALGFYFSELLNSYAGGFGLIALLYLIIAIIVILIKDNHIEKHLHNFTVKRFFRHRKEDGKLH